MTIILRDKLTRKIYLYMISNMMTEMTIGEFKTHFSEVVKKVRTGEKIAVTSGKKKEIVGYFVPEIYENTTKRKLGILEGKAEVIFADDFKMTEEEFLGL